MNRRVFLKQSARWVVRLAAVGVALPALDGCHHDAARSAADAGGHPDAPWKPKVLGAAEAVAIEAMLERLLPSNVPPGTPGAKEAQVLRYLDGQLQKPYFHGFQRLVGTGARYLDLVARKEHHLPFARLTPAQQDDQLRRFQTGRIPIRFPLARFFGSVWSFALEGFLGDPKYGGNAGGIVWQSIDFDPDLCGVAKP